MRIHHLLLGGIALGAAAAASSAVIVVRSSGPSASSYPSGRSIPDSARITLKANDTLVLLDSKGSRTLRGPGTFPAAAPAGAKGSTTSLAALIGQSTNRRSRIGAVRPGPIPRWTWDVQPGRSETICIAPDVRVRLWRDDIAGAETVSIRNLDTGGTATAAMGAGIQAVEWPADMPLVDGARYKVGKGEIAVKAIPAPASLEALAGALAANGCTGQLEAVSTQTAMVE